MAFSKASRPVLICSAVILGAVLCGHAFPAHAQSAGNNQGGTQNGQSNNNQTNTQTNTNQSGGQNNPQSNNSQSGNQNSPPANTNQTGNQSNSQPNNNQSGNQTNPQNGNTAEEQNGKFDSPFRGKRDLDSDEGKDWTALMDAYDKLKDAEAVMDDCKGHTTTAASKAYLAADKEFESALQHYVSEWNPVNVGGRTQTVGFRERIKILKALGKQDKKKHEVKKCPETETPIKPNPDRPKADPDIKKHHALSEDDPRYLEYHPPTTPSGRNKEAKKPTLSEDNPRYLERNPPATRNGTSSHAPHPPVPRGSHGEVTDDRIDHDDRSKPNTGDVPYSPKPDAPASSPH